MTSKPVFLTCKTCRGSGEYRSGLHRTECPECLGEGRVLAGKAKLAAERERLHCPTCGPTTLCPHGYSDLA